MNISLAVMANAFEELMKPKQDNSSPLYLNIEDSTQNSKKSTLAKINNFLQTLLSNIDNQTDPKHVSVIKEGCQFIVTKINAKHEKQGRLSCILYLFLSIFGVGYIGRVNKTKKLLENITQRLDDITKHEFELNLPQNLIEKCDKNWVMDFVKDSIMSYHTAQLTENRSIKAFELDACRSLFDISIQDGESSISYHENEVKKENLKDRVQFINKVTSNEHTFSHIFQTILTQALNLGCLGSLKGDILLMEGNTTKNGHFYYKMETQKNEASKVNIVINRFRSGNIKSLEVTHLCHLDLLKNTGNDSWKSIKTHAITAELKFSIKEGKIEDKKTLVFEEMAIDYSCVN
jgi:hypothetical protein